MIDIKKTWLNEKQFELLKLTFSNEHVLEKLECWQKRYALEELDNKTRMILPILMQKLHSIGAPIKNNLIYKKYSNYHENIWLSNLKKIHAFNDAIHKLCIEKIDICLLKGASMLLYYYKNMGMRPEHSDIDILIKPNDLRKTLTILKQQGFETYGRPSQFIEESLKNCTDFPKTYFHAVTLFKGNLFIDIHWRHIKFFPKPTFDLIKSEMKPVKLKNDSLYILSIEQQFIHIISHGMSDPTNFNFIWILDALFLLENYGNSMNFNDLKYWSEKYKLTTFLSCFMMFAKTINLDFSSSFSNKMDTLKPDPALLKFFYRIQLRKRHFIRKISFYICLYLTRFEKESFAKKIFKLKDFVRYNFGVSKQESVLLFILKNFFIHLRKKP